MQFRPTPEILGAGISPTYDAAEGTEGMVLREENGGLLWMGEGLYQGPSLECTSSSETKIWRLARQHFKCHGTASTPTWRMTNS